MPVLDPAELNVSHLHLSNSFHHVRPQSFRCRDQERLPCRGYEKIEYDFTFLDGVFNPANNNLAKCYERWGRCLAVMDLNIYNVYGDEMQKYFDHYNLPLTIHKTMIGEKAKSMETLLSIVDSMTDFGIIRKEPVLVVVCYPV